MFDERFKIELNFFKLAQACRRSEVAKRCRSAAPLATAEQRRHYRSPDLRGHGIATVYRPDATGVIRLRTTGSDPAAATGGSAGVGTKTATLADGKREYKVRKIANNDRPELTATKIIVSGGRALAAARISAK